MSIPLPKFASWHRNLMAAEENPTRDGMFVRVDPRAPGRMNPGIWFEMTDGRGRFWECRPADLSPVKAPER